jgi:hypothetical protein
MKRMSKFSKSLFFAGSLVLGLSVPADAQQGLKQAVFSTTAYETRPDALSLNAARFYHPYVYPQVGQAVKNVPTSRYAFVWNNYPFYYADVLFYQSYADGSFKIAAPPIGAEVPSLPIESHIITIDGYPYYQYKGVYYDSVIRPGADFAYKVVGKDGIPSSNSGTAGALPLIGDMIDRLPEGAHQVKLNGKHYWVTPDEIYLEEVEGEKNVRYRVVAIPEKKAVSDPREQGTSS